MKVRTEDGRTVSLTKRDFVAQGGQGSVYVKGSEAFKIYTDPSHVIPAGKIRELAAITDPRVIRPEQQLCNARGKPVGFTMRRVDAEWTLCQLFTRAFRERNGLSPEKALRLVDGLRRLVARVHAASVVVADLNELNVLVADGFQEMYLIDVDSYQTPSYPAMAIMDSIRDRHAPLGCFTELTDWFSFAVVTFQLLVGVHPYKGKHPTLRGLDERMLANVSAFNPEVRLPRSAFPLDSIPSVLGDWYRAVLEDGQRMAPPEGTGTIALPARPAAPVRSGRLDVIELDAFDARIRASWEHDGTTVVLTDRGTHVDGRLVTNAPARPLAVGFTSRRGRPIAATIDDGGLRLFDLVERRDVPVSLRAQAITCGGGRLHVKSGDTLQEIVFSEIGNQVVAATRLAANVMAHATRLHEGVAVQDVLGATWVALLAGDGAVHQYHLPELDGHEVVEARHDDGVLMVLGVRDGRWDRLVFRFDHAKRAWDVRCVEDVDAAAGLNFITLGTGVCTCLGEDDEMEVFPARMGVDGMRLVRDPALGGDMILSRRGTRLVAARGDKVHGLSLR